MLPHNRDGRKFPDGRERIGEKERRKEREKERRKEKKEDRGESRFPTTRRYQRREYRDVGKRCNEPTHVAALADGGSWLGTPVPFLDFHLKI